MSTLLVRRVEARVFVSPKSLRDNNSIINNNSPQNKTVGGNPVTVFFTPPTSDTNAIHASTTITPETAVELAKSCEWESVVVNWDVTQQGLPRFQFYLPSGEEVCFCAHAAMGACAVVSAAAGITSLPPKLFLNSESPDQIKFHVGTRDDSQIANIFTIPNEMNNIRQIPLNSLEVELPMSHEVQESEIGTAPDKTSTAFIPKQNEQNVLNDILSSLHLTPMDVYAADTICAAGSKLTERHTFFPPFLNSSVARTKTLVHISELSKLHSAKRVVSDETFRDLCDSIESTGIYLYTPIYDSVNPRMPLPLRYECRQFPRASGYVEDPATGIAAAALACSLRKHNQRDFETNNDIVPHHEHTNSYDRFEFYQGTAMGRPSKITIRFVENKDQHCDNTTAVKRTTTRMLCSGLVEIGLQKNIMI